MRHRFAGLALLIVGAFTVLNLGQATEGTYAPFSDVENVNGTATAGVWTGTLKIIKHTNIATTKLFAFTGDDGDAGGDGLPAAFNVQGGLAPGNSQTYEVNTQDGGVFTVTETVPSYGWSLATLTCVDPTTNSAQSGPGSYTANINVAGGETVECTFVNNQETKNFLVKKDFSDNDTQNVTMTLACANGTESTLDGDANDAPLLANQDAADFTVIGYEGDVICTGTEVMIDGYTASSSPGGAGTCQANLSAGQCTITNTLNSATFEVKKVYSPSSNPTGPDVNISLVCGSGNVTSSGTPIGHDETIVFTVKGIIGASTTCTASEGVPSGYTSDQTTTCVNITLGANENDAPIECTITNTLNSSTFSVKKLYSPSSNPTGPNVDVSLSCLAGTVVTGAQSIAHNGVANFTVTGIPAAGTTCTATETPVPNGYSSDQATTCAAIALGANDNDVDIECTITNTLTTATFEVTKLYSPSNDPGPDVTITLVCGTGTPTSVDATIGHNQTAIFTVTGIVGPSTTCTATESPVPVGFGSNQATTCANITLNVGGTASCVITNTKDAPPPCETAGIYLMLDRTGSMLGADLTNERTAAKGLLGIFDNLVDVPQVAIGAFGATSGGGQANTVHALTNTESPAPYGDDDAAADSDLYAAIDTATGSNSGVGTHIDSAINTAVAGLAAATGKVLVLISDGEDTDGTAGEEAALDAADTAKLAGVRIIAIHFGANPTGFGGHELMAALSTGTVAAPATDSHNTHGHQAGSDVNAGTENSDGDNFYIAPSSSDLITIFNDLASSGALCDGEFLPQGDITLNVVTGSDTTVEADFTVVHNVGGGCVLSPLDTETSTSTAPSTRTCAGVTPGSYTLTVTPPAGYFITDISCTGDANLLIGADADFDPGDNAVTIDLDASENVICTVTARNDRAWVTIIKVDTTDSGTDFAFTDDFSAGCNVGTLDDDGGSNATNPDSRTCLVQSGTDRDVQESAVVGWQTTNIVCSGTGVTGIEYGLNGASFGTYQAGDNSARVDLDAGEHATCTFTNAINTATVNVSKDFSDNAATNVTISLTCTSGTVSIVDATAQEGVDTANFTVTGFNTVGSTCSATDTVAGYFATGCTSQAISAGGTLNCTVTNTAAADLDVSIDDSPSALGAAEDLDVLDGNYRSKVSYTFTNNGSSTIGDLDFTGAIAGTAPKTTSSPAATFVSVSGTGTGMTCTFPDNSGPAQTWSCTNGVLDAGETLVVTFAITGTGATAGQTVTYTPAVACASVGPCTDLVVSLANSDGSQLLFSDTDTLMVPTGNITITKDTSVSTETTFAFTSNIGSGTCTVDATPAAFSLDDGGDATPPNTEVCTGVTVGSYTVTQTPVVNGWVLTAVGCTGDPDVQIGSVANGFDSNFDDGDNAVIIDLDNAENVNCTFTSTAVADLDIVFAEANGTEDLNDNNSIYTAEARYTLTNQGAATTGTVTFTGSISKSSTLSVTTYTIVEDSASWTCSFINILTDSRDWTCSGTLAAGATVNIDISLSGDDTSGTRVITYTPGVPSCAGGPATFLPDGCVDGTVSDSNHDGGDISLPDDTDTIS